jgi:anaerobic magnesium-protoporphyrin IX monomethyl ester cyclase
MSRIPRSASRIPDDHLPPLGLLAIGGPLIDDGHEVRLIDAEFGPKPTRAIHTEAVGSYPDAVLFGHSGSTSGHLVIAEVAQAIAKALPRALIVYGGVFPTCHWREILSQESYVTAIVRGEDEETVRRLMRALEFRQPPRRGCRRRIPRRGRPSTTRPAPVIRDLDAYRIGWELIDHARYSYWAGCAPRWCSSRVAVRTSAIIAASAVSGRAGGIAIRFASHKSWRGCIVSTASG